MSSKFSGLSVKELKKHLNDRSIDFSGCTEKSELVDLLVEFDKKHPKGFSPAPGKEKYLRTPPEELPNIPPKKDTSGVDVFTFTQNMVKRTKKNYNQALECCGTEQWAAVGIANILHTGSSPIVNKTVPETLEALISKILYSQTTEIRKCGFIGIGNVFAKPPLRERAWQIFSRFPRNKYKLFYDRVNYLLNAGERREPYIVGLYTALFNMLDVDNYVPHVLDNCPGLIKHVVASCANKKASPEERNLAAGCIHNIVWNPTCLQRVQNQVGAEIISFYKRIRSIIIKRKAGLVARGPELSYYFFLTMSHMARVPEFSQMCIDKGALETLPELMLAPNLEVRETAIGLANNVNASLENARYLWEIGCFIPALKNVDSRFERTAEVSSSLILQMVYNLADLNSFCRRETENYAEMKNTLKRIPRNCEAARTILQAISKIDLLDSQSAPSTNAPGAKTKKQLRMCRGCSSQEPPDGSLKFKQCSRCRQAYYCSVKCQKEDWKDHKIVCNHLSKVTPIVKHKNDRHCNSTVVQAVVQKVYGMIAIQAMTKGLAWESVLVYFNFEKMEDQPPLGMIPQMEVMDIFEFFAGKYPDNEVYQSESWEGVKCQLEMHQKKKESFPNLRQLIIMAQYGNEIGCYRMPV